MKDTRTCERCGKRIRHARNGILMVPGKEVEAAASKGKRARWRLLHEECLGARQEPVWIRLAHLRDRATLTSWNNFLRDKAWVNTSDWVEWREAFLAQMKEASDGDSGT